MEKYLKKTSSDLNNRITYDHYKEHHRLGMKAFYYNKKLSFDLLQKAYYYFSRLDSRALKGRNLIVSKKLEEICHTIVKLLNNEDSLLLYDLPVATLNKITAQMNTELDSLLRLVNCHDFIKEPLVIHNSFRNLVFTRVQLREYTRKLQSNHRIVNILYKFLPLEDRDNEVSYFIECELFKDERFKYEKKTIYIRVYNFRFIGREYLERKSRFYEFKNNIGTWIY